MGKLIRQVLKLKSVTVHIHIVLESVTFLTQVFWLNFPFISSAFCAFLLCTLSLNTLRKKKSIGVKSGDRKGFRTTPLRTVNLPEKLSSIDYHGRHGAPSCKFSRGESDRKEENYPRDYSHATLYLLLGHHIYTHTHASCMCVYVCAGVFLKKWIYKYVYV
jgi:hypothetical protein